jgi:hypothetical protein
MNEQGCKGGAVARSGDSRDQGGEVGARRHRQPHPKRRNGFWRARAGQGFDRQGMHPRLYALARQLDQQTYRMVP